MSLAVFLDSIARLVALCLLTALSGLISASETALFALSRQQLNRFRQSKNPAAQTILRLRDDPSNLLSTVLLANIAVNIFLYSMLGITVARLSNGSTYWTALLGMSGFFLVLLGAEIVPKLLAFAISERLAPLVAVPIRVLEVVTFPLRRFLDATIVEPLTRIFSPSQPDTDVSADELQELVNISQDEGLIDQRENILLHQLMDLSDMRVSALMVPRVDVVAFNLNDDPQQLVELFKSSRLLHMPVYDQHIDNIQGVVDAKESLLHPDIPIRELIHPVPFIPEQARVEALLDHFRDSGSQLALVVDEYGGLAGLIALEDVVEAIVGELYAPEEQAALPLLSRIDETTFLVNAGLDVNDFCRAFELPIEETRINTVAGLIADKLDRLPQTGDIVIIDHTELIVVQMKRRRILRVRVKLQHSPRDNPDLRILMEQAAQDQSLESSSPTQSPPTGDKPT